VLGGAAATHDVFGQSMGAHEDHSVSGGAPEKEGQPLTEFRSWIG